LFGREEGGEMPTDKQMAEKYAAIFKHPLIFDVTWVTSIHNYSTQAICYKNFQYQDNEGNVAGIDPNNPPLGGFVSKQIEPGCPIPWNLNFDQGELDDGQYLAIHTGTADNLDGSVIPLFAIWQNGQFLWYTSTMKIRESTTVPGADGITGRRTIEVRENANRVLSINFVSSP